MPIKKHFDVIAISCLFSFYCFNSFSQTNGDKLDLKSRWLIWEDNLNSYTTFVDSKKTKTIHFWIDRNLPKGTLSLSLPRETTLYINQKIWKYFQYPETIEISRDSLLGIQSEIFISVSLKNLYKQNLITEYYISSVSYNINPKSKSSFREFNIFSVLVILLLLGTTRLFYPRVFREFYSLQRAISNRTREELILRSKFNTTHNWVMLGFFGLITSLLFLIILETNTQTINFNLANLESFSSLFINWIIIALIIGMLTILKWYLVYNLSSLFKLQDFKQIHFFNSLRMSLISISGGLFVYELLFIGFKISDPAIYSLLIILVVILLTLRTLVIFLKLLNYSSYTFVHLLSYLCGTEIIPILIGLKIVLIKG